MLRILHWQARALAIASLVLMPIATCNADSVAIRMSPIPAPESTRVTGASWLAIGGANKRKFVTAIFRPQGAGPFPTVVVLHGASGLADSYLQVAEHLAQEGFLAVAGCWQAGKLAMPICAEATPEAEWIADPAANSGKEIIAAATGLPDARPDRIALFGLSRGGHAALWAAASGASVSAIVVDAPAHSPAIFPAPASTLKIVDKISAPILMMHGTSDYVIPVGQTREYEKVAKALGKPVTAVYFDGAGHMVSVQSGSRAEALKRAVAFLRDYLR